MFGIKGNTFGILLDMFESLQFSFVMVGDAIYTGMLNIAMQPDVKNALLQGGIWSPKKDNLVEGLSMILSVSRESAHIVVVRGEDFLAEAAIVVRSPKSTLDTFRDLLGHDPDDAWFGTLGRRNQVTSVLNTLVPPYCVVAWKTRAADRLSRGELTSLRAELLRVVSGLMFELLEGIEREKSNP